MFSLSSGQVEGENQAASERRWKEAFSEKKKSENRFSFVLALQVGLFRIQTVIRCEDVQLSVARFNADTRNESYHYHFTLSNVLPHVDRQV